MSRSSAKFKGIFRKVGSVGVDSGQIIVIDPCYLDKWEDGECEWDSVGEESNHYAMVCNLTTGGEKGQIPAGEFQRDGVQGVASQSCWGDGYYPVYAVLNNDGRIAQLVIDFDNHPDLEGEDE